jgi:hypothetical protein
MLEILGIAEEIPEYFGTSRFVAIVSKTKWLTR